MSSRDSDWMASSANPLTGRQLTMLPACILFRVRLHKVPPVCGLAAGTAKPILSFVCVRCSHPDDFCSSGAPTVIRRSSQAARTEHVMLQRGCRDGEHNG